jgi:hypothetical protein
MATNDRERLDLVLTRNPNIVAPVLGWMLAEVLDDAQLEQVLAQAERWAIDLEGYDIVVVAPEDR